MSASAATAKTDEPDFDHLAELAAEIASLKAKGAWTRAEFDRIWAEGEKAAAGHGELLEFIANEGDEDWL